VSDAGLMRVRCRCCLQSNSAGSYSCVASNAVQANRGTSIPTTSAACAVSTAGFIAWQCAGPEDPWCMLPLEWLLSGLTHIASTTTCNIMTHLPSGVHESKPVQPVPRRCARLSHCERCVEYMSMRSVSYICRWLSGMVELMFGFACGVRASA
jgi:hypothetical protein